MVAWWIRVTSLVIYFLFSGILKYYYNRKCLFRTLILSINFTLDVPILLGIGSVIYSSDFRALRMFSITCTYCSVSKFVIYPYEMAVDRFL